jgi:hypothetical protein
VVDWDYVSGNYGLFKVGQGVDQVANWTKEKWNKLEQSWATLGKG